MKAQVLGKKPWKHCTGVPSLIGFISYPSARGRSSDEQRPVACNIQDRYIRAFTFSKTLKSWLDSVMDKTVDLQLFVLGWHLDLGWLTYVVDNS